MVDRRCDAPSASAGRDCDGRSALDLRSDEPVNAWVIVVLDGDAAIGEQQFEHLHDLSLGDAGCYLGRVIEYLLPIALAAIEEPRRVSGSGVSA